MNYTAGMTLGEVIDALSACSEASSVKFDFGGLIPTKIECYRGYYDKPALGWATNTYWHRHKHETDKPIAAHELVKELNSALNSVYTAWKGGEYTFTRADTLYIDNPGEYNSIVVAAVRNAGYFVTLLTTSVE